MRPAAKATAKAKIVFEMDEDVALWLKSLMQNPLYDDETEEEKKYRMVIFYAILRVDSTPLQQSMYNLDDIPF